MARATVIGAMPIMTAVITRIVLHVEEVIGDWRLSMENASSSRRR